MTVLRKQDRLAEIHHLDRINPVAIREFIAKRVPDAMETEIKTFGSWLDMKLVKDPFLNWIKKDVCKAWGLHAAARLFHICGTGFDGRVGRSKPGNDGRMRLIVGCTLEEPEVSAIAKGAALAESVEAAILRVSFEDLDRRIEAALELLAWMVARGILEVKVAVPCDRDRRPVAGTAIFHENAGIIEDKTGSRLAFTGSLNETVQGWRYNWDSFHVFTDWTGTRAHVDDEEGSFARLWADKAKTAIVVNVPTAVKEKLLQLLPDPPAAPPVDLRRLVWGFIRHAPAMPNGGERVW